MKLIASLLILLCSVYSSFGQVNYKHNAVRSGDEIVKQQVEYKDPGRSGEQVIWNFSQLKALNPEYELTYISPALLNDSIYILGRDTISQKSLGEDELIIGIEHRTLYYYRQSQDSLLCLGHENSNTLLKYEKPLLVINYPFSYGTKAESLFATKGLYSLSEPFKTDGKIEIENDATGMMILPSGDTLNNVIRIKSTRQYIESDTIIVSPNMTIENYKWYVVGYRYPVFETIRSFNPLDTIQAEAFGTAFFYPPQEHYYLLNDDENLSVLDSIANGRDRDIDDPTDPNHPMNRLDGFSYNFYPNPVKTLLYVEYFLEEQANVGVSLYTMSGQLIKDIPGELYNQGLYDKQIDCSGIPAGTYILQIKIDNTIVNEKIIKK